MKEPLVVGCNGYLGSRLCLETGWPGVDLPTKYSDLKSEDLPETVVFLAGHSTVPSCRDDVAGSYKNNVADFADFAKKCRRIVFASSLHVYGDGIVTEQSPCSPSNEYGKQKLTAELLCAGAESATCLRFGVIAGKSPKMRWDILINKMVSDARLHGEVRVDTRDFWRPVLGIGDACAAVTRCVGRWEPGTYNVRSFNDQISAIGLHVSCAMNVPVWIGKIGASRGVTMNADKFCTAFNFRFNDSLHSITKELLS